MATPTQFKGSNEIVKSVGGEELPIYKGNADLGGEPPLITSLILSAWELSDEELKEINRTKKVFLGCIGVIAQPPVYITAFNPVGKEPSKRLIIT